MEDSLSVPLLKPEASRQRAQALVQKSSLPLRPLSASDDLIATVNSETSLSHSLTRSANPQFMKWPVFNSFNYSAGRPRVWPQPSAPGYLIVNVILLEVSLGVLLPPP